MAKKRLPQNEWISGEPFEEGWTYFKGPDTKPKMLGWWMARTFPANGRVYWQVWPGSWDTFHLGIPEKGEAPTTADAQKAAKLKIDELAKDKVSLKHMEGTWGVKE